ncbi:MAG TPA: sigma 54-interacting transcriptional regulator [Polyangiaceae bacterium]
MTEPTSDTFRDSQAPGSPDLMTLRPYLFVVLECDRPAAGGARYALSGVEEIVIGRGPERRATRQITGGISRLIVSVPGRSMSSTHARLLHTGDGWVVEDAHSTNGSYVNGHNVDRAVLRDDDVLELGHTLFLLRSAIPAPLATPEDLDSADLTLELPGFSTLVPAAAPDLASLGRIAKSNISILLLGETGTGKEVIARSVHVISGRKGPFIALNCGAIPANLVESQLFGHQKGSFSGAVKDEQGLIRAADDGTLLLDEIGDLPAPAQPALLRFLQENEVTPVGGARPYKVDVRVVAATHQPLAQLVDKREFRADLFARLGGFTHAVSSLRHRREDLGLLIARILARREPQHPPMAIAPAAGRQLLRHDWPANIRELEQALVRGLTLAGGGIVETRHLFVGGATGLAPPATADEPIGEQKPLSETDAKLRRELLLLLEHHKGNVSDVARALGKARMQVQRWIKRYEIDLNLFRQR